VIKGQDVSVADLLFHWSGLGRQGDALVIRLLNRQNSWETIAQLAQHHPELHGKLGSLADSAGVTGQAARILELAGIAVSTGDCPRTRALWIEQAVREDRTADWDRARYMMLHDPDLLAGVLPLLETGDVPEHAARFITTVLVEKLSLEQDQSLRRVLYHLRQRGVVVEEHREALMHLDKEMFAYGENRVPMWQPALYFRAHSAFTSSGDLYALSLYEGKSFEASDQKRDLHLDREGFRHLAEQYSLHIQTEMALAVPFRVLSPGTGRYFLQKTEALLRGTPASDRILEFFKFMGDGQAEDPLAALRAHDPQPLAVASNVLTDPYFVHWMLDSEDIREYLSELERMQSGPIILPESQLREKSRQAAHQALARCLTGPARMLWSFAFEKAAFFLGGPGQPKAVSAYAISRGLADLTISVEDLYVATWLFERSVAREAEAKKKEQQEEHRGSLIMTPAEFQKQIQRKP
jgi:hypothetical protein